MKIETSAKGRIIVKIPKGVYLSVPAMGTTAGQMSISVTAPTEGEVLRKLDEFWENFRLAYEEAAEDQA